MSRKRVNAICRSFPGAKVSDPWGGGHDAWKVGGKMFACIGAVAPGVSVKTDSIETAEDELRHRLTTSYRLVRSSLPKKVQAALAPFP